MATGDTYQLTKSYADLTCYTFQSRPNILAFLTSFSPLYALQFMGSPLPQLLLLFITQLFSLCLAFAILIILALVSTSH